MRWMGLLLGVPAGAVVAAYLSMVVELDRMPRKPVHPRRAAAGDATRSEPPAFATSAAFATTHD
jgi:hypothetical protein